MSSITGVILFLAGCASLNSGSTPNGAFNQRVLRDAVNNSALKQVRIKSFNLSLSHLMKVCDSNFNARCGARFRELLSSQQGLTRCFALQRKERNDAIDLGVWLGVNGRKRIANTGFVRVYECSFFSAAMGMGSESGCLLTNGTFTVERPTWNNSNTAIDEDAVITEALHESANRICAELRCRFPISGRVLSSRSNEWIMVDKGAGDGVLSDDLILLYTADRNSVSLIGVAKATPQSGRSLGRIVWVSHNIETLNTFKGVSVIIGPQELLARIRNVDR